MSVDGSRRGIYLRESCSLQKPIVASVKVEPKYNDDAGKQNVFLGFVCYVLLFGNY